MSVRNVKRHVKQARRALRAAGLTTTYGLTPGVLSPEQFLSYKNQMEIIDNYQLELEGLKVEAAGLPAFMKLSGIQLNLGLMEDYLRKILSEFERFCPLLNGGNAVDFMELQRLDEFTGNTSRHFLFRPVFPTEIPKPCRLKKDFARSYAEVIKDISRNLGAGGGAGFTVSDL